MKKRMSKGTVIILIISLILILTGVYLIIYDDSGIGKDKFVFSENCDGELVTQINNLIDEANYCKKDSDCILTTEVLVDCSCYSLVNKNADLSLIKDGQRIWNEKFSAGIEVCTSPSCFPCHPTPTQNDIKCIDKKCHSVLEDKFCQNDSDCDWCENCVCYLENCVVSYS